MPGTAIGLNLNLGYAGKVSRNPDNIITQRPVKSILDGNNAETQPSIVFGDPVVLNADNTYSRFGATGSGVAAATADNFAGVAVAEVKQGTSYLANVAGQYDPKQPCDVISRGSVTVLCRVGTPVAGGPVYIRTALNASIPNGVIGGFEAAADGSNTVLIPNAKWTTGNKDANNIAEITLLTRVNP